jgi:hypothetical protein
VTYVPRLLELLGKRLPGSAHVQYLLKWSLCLLQAHGSQLRKDGPRLMPAFRALQKALLRMQDDLVR